MKLPNCYRMKIVLVVFVAAIVLGVGSAKADFTFGEPVNLGPPFDGPGREFLSCFSADGLEMYLVCCDRPGGYGGCDVWVSTRETIDHDWVAPVNIGPPINTGLSEVCAYISADGLELYFSSNNRPGGYGSGDIWVSRRSTKSDAWDTPVNLGPVVNSSAWEECSWISNDGLELYIDSTRSGGYGSDDIWVSTRSTVNDPWEPPVNLGPVVNSNASESTHNLSSDSLMLFFSDYYRPYRPGGFGKADMWMTRRASLSDPWGTPVNLGPIVNTTHNDRIARISPDGSTLYFHSDRPGGSGDCIIYQAPIIPFVDFNGDDFIDTDDLLIMINNWGTDETLCDIGPMPWGDGIVDKEDLEVLMNYWGQKFEFVPCYYVACWRLDESEGDMAYDNAGENDGTLYGEPLWQPDEGIVNGAIELDGIDDYISTPFVLNPEYGKFSVFAWIKGGAAGQVIVSQRDGANWLMADPSDGKLMTALSRPAGGRIPPMPLVSESIITDNAWHQIGLTWDGSSRTLYVDDVGVASDTQTGLAGSTGGLYIGAGKSLETGTHWSGLIDDIRIYNRAITP